MKKELSLLWKQLLEKRKKQNWKQLLNKHNDLIDISDCITKRQLPSELQYVDLELSRLKFSLLFLKPKPQFFLWLQSVLDDKRHKIQIEDIYFSEEDGVWLIPDTFHSHSHFKAFIQCLKPIMLKRELGQFGPSELMPTNLSPETFDEFFEIHIRDKAINSLGFLKNEQI